jgi:3-deoxy-D-manno-octulosonic-acid transferase
MSLPTAMLRSAYRTAGRVAPPVLNVMLARRAGAGKEVAARLAERRGVASRPRPAGRLIWFHAASVGEFLSALPVIEALAGTSVLLTTGTVTSAELAAQRLPAYAIHQFAPLDALPWVDAFLTHWQPSAAVFVESELWPTMLDECDARGIPRLLINARLSARAAARWQKAEGFAGSVLWPFRYIHAQSAGDAARLAGFGVTGILQWGNLKLAAATLPVDEATLAAFQAICPGPVFLAASTHAGEEEIVLAAHARLVTSFPGLVTIIVPRHPPRGAEVARLCGAPRRAAGGAPVPGKVYVADTLGELGLFFRAASFAFIGNSLVAGGGHNVVEPAMLGRPVITGPHLENFQEAAATMHEAGALALVTDAASLAAAAAIWLRDPAAAAAAGAAARAAFAPLADLPGRLAALIAGCAL